MYVHMHVHKHTCDYVLYLGMHTQPQVQHIVEQAGVKNLQFRHTLEEALELTQGDMIEMMSIK